MENLDQSILFLVLGVVGVLLLFLLRRPSAVENAVVPHIVAVPPVVVPVPEVVAVPVVAEVQPSSPTPTMVKPRKRRIAKPTVVPVAEPAPMETVVGMLKQKDTLVAAFLLREIFDSPMSEAERAAHQVSGARSPPRLLHRYHSVILLRHEDFSRCFGELLRVRGMGGQQCRHDSTTGRG